MVLRGHLSAIVILICFGVAQLIYTCEAVDLEFKTYHFRKKSREGKAVNRAESHCRDEVCKLIRGVAEQICIRKCISPKCHKEMYAWNELETGERDIRWSSFKGCAAHEISKKNMDYI